MKALIITVVILLVLLLVAVIGWIITANQRDRTIKGWNECQELNRRIERFINEESPSENQ